VEQIKVIPAKETHDRLLRRHHASFTFGEDVGSKSFPVPDPRDSNGCRAGNRFVPIFGKRAAAPFFHRGFTSVELVDQRNKDITWRGKKYCGANRWSSFAFISAPKKRGRRSTLAT